MAGNRKSAHVLFMDDLFLTVAPAIAYLTMEGYRVSSVSNAAHAKAAVDVGDVDLVILDVDLLPIEAIESRRRTQIASGESSAVPEEGAGYEVAGWMSRHHPHVGVIMYSSQRTDAESQVEGLNQGADDYIVKTDNYALLLARVQSVLRRRRFVQGALVTIDEYEMDLGAKTIASPSGDRIKLSDAEFRLLETLAMSPRKTLDREQLYDAAFKLPMPSDHNRAIDTLVSNLRKKLSYESMGTSKLVTIHGVGYRLDADVSYKW